MESLKVKDWMSKNLIGITSEETISDAAARMKDRKVGMLVVFNRKDDSILFKKRMTGIISDSDIVRRVVSKGLDCSKESVKDHMTSDTIVCSPENTFKEIGDIMISQNVKRLPIVDGDHAYAIVSLTDLIDWLSEETGRAREIISEELSEILMSRYGVSPSNPPKHPVASSFMSKNVISVESGSPVIKAAALIADHFIGAAPVTYQGSLVGMITITDIVRRLVAEGKDINSTKVEDIMTSPAISADISSPLPEVIDLLSDHRIKHVTVLNESVLCGIISHKDVMKEIMKIGMPYYLSRLGQRS